ncbi:MAG: tRNA dihydrouridine(20/20a) synthase DusA [Elainellaceae cyanobacterium]
MMDRTDRHFRYFMRLITRRSLLYTEMVTTGAILHGDRDHLLGFSPEEKPLALQLGGDNPKALGRCSRIAFDRGYDEVNLNVGCPSDRVQNGHFGACLMAQPERVADCVATMKAAVPIPVTVKHRIGIDERDRYEDMAHFVETVAAAGCRHFTVHARKAWLQGLNPKQNRTVPPLRYEDVYRLKREFPHLVIEINGGITTLTQVQDHLQHVDAVMVGRAAYDDPYLFAAVDGAFFANDGPMQWSQPGSEGPSRREVAEAMMPYIDAWTKRWDGKFKMNKITRHMLQLFAGQPGSKAWKRHLTENACRPGTGSEVVRQALALVPRLESAPEQSTGLKSL